MWSEAELHGSLNVDHVAGSIKARKNLSVELSADSSNSCFKIHFTAGMLRSKVNCAVLYDSITVLFQVTCKSSHIAKLTNQMACSLELIM